MKAKPYQIDALKTQICTSYKAVLIHGADFSVVEDCAEQIRRLIQPQKDDFSFIKINKAQLKEIPSLLLDEGNAISFLGTRKLICLKDADNTTTKAIENYLEHIQTNAFLLLTADALPKSSSLRMLAETAPDVLEIACYTDEIRDIQVLITSYLKERGYVPSQSAMTLLLERLNTNRLATKSELEKLITYMGQNNQINERDVEAVIPDTAMASIDMLCQAVGTGDQKTADKACQILLSSGETPVGITRILMAHFNKLLLGAEMAENRFSQEEILKKLLRSNQFKQKEAMSRQISIWKKPFIIKTLQLLLETEQQTKTTGLPPELMLERTITMITGLPKKLQRY